jgi:hypothetical protein
MKTLLLGLLGLAVAFVPAQSAEKKAEKPKAVGEVPPHPLDGAFKGGTERSITDGLINNDLFKRAVREALARKIEHAQRFKDNPKLRDASPDRAARIRFLEVLNQTDEK